MVIDPDVTALLCLNDRLAFGAYHVLFGLVLGSTPIGDSVNNALTLFGAWLWKQLVAV